MGGHDRRASCRGDRLARAAVDTGDRPGDRCPRGASERAVHGAGAPVSDHRSPLGGSEWRPDQRVRLRRPARRNDSARVPDVQLDGGRVRRRDHGVGDDRRRGRRRRPRSPRPDGDAPVLRISHGRLLPALDPDATIAVRDAESVPRELVPQGRRRASSCGRASGRTCAS